MASMKAREYAPIERLDSAPIGPYVSPGQREEALSDALRGVDLGANDELVVGWLVRHLDNTTLRTLVSLIERARGAGMVHMLDIEASLADQARQKPADQARQKPADQACQKPASQAWQEPADRPDREDRPDQGDVPESAAGQRFEGRPSLRDWPSSWVAGNSGPGF
jgi:hypothetical protein